MNFSDVAATSVLLPILAGLVLFKQAENIERYILFFLCLGLLVDGSMQLGYNYNIRQSIISIYSLVESLFFIFLLCRFFENSGIKKMLVVSGIFFIVLWSLAYVIFKNVDFLFSTIRELFDMFYYMVVSFFSGFLLLKMIEKKEATDASSFWFVLALFVYCFCTFFLAAFIHNKMAEQIWFLHNIVGIIANLIFVKAFLTIKRKK